MSFEKQIPDEGVHETFDGLEQPKPDDPRIEALYNDLRVLAEDPRELLVLALSGITVPLDQPKRCDEGRLYIHNPSVMCHALCAYLSHRSWICNLRGNQRHGSGRGKPHNIHGQRVVRECGCLWRPVRSRPH